MVRHHVQSALGWGGGVLSDLSPGGRAAGVTPYLGQRLPALLPTKAHSSRGSSFSQILSYISSSLPEYFSIKCGTSGLIRLSNYRASSRQNASETLTSASFSGLCCWYTCKECRKDPLRLSTARCSG